MASFKAYVSDFPGKHTGKAEAEIPVALLVGVGVEPNEGGEGGDSGEEEVDEGDIACCIISFGQKELTHPEMLHH